MNIQQFPVDDSEEALQFSSALTSGKPVDVIQSWIRANPSLVKVGLAPTRCHGTVICKRKLAIHLALHPVYKGIIADDVILFLVECFPPGLAVRNSTGHLPLHVYLAGEPSLSVVKKLVETYPRYTKITDEGALIHDALLCRNPSSELVRFLIKQDPDGLKVKRKNNGNLPLHDASLRKPSYHCSITKDIFQLFVEMYPRAVASRNAYGCLPWHLCYEEWKLEILFKASPFTVLVPQPIVLTGPQRTPACNEYLMEQHKMAKKKVKAMRRALCKVHRRLSIPEEVMTVTWCFLIEEDLNIAYGDRKKNKKRKRNI